MRQLGDWPSEAPLLTRVALQAHLPDGFSGQFLVRRVAVSALLRFLAVATCQEPLKACAAARRTDLSRLVLKRRALLRHLTVVRSGQFLVRWVAESIPSVI